MINDGVTGNPSRWAQKEEWGLENLLIQGRQGKLRC